MTAVSDWLGPGTAAIVGIGPVLAQAPPTRQQYAARGRSRLRCHPGVLGPAAAAGAAGPVARHADPLHHRDRLPAVQLLRPRRQSGGPERGSRAHDLRGAENRLHRSDAAVRYAVAVACRQPRRCGDGLDRRHAGGRKLADFSDPYYRTPGRFVARRDTVLNDVRPEQLEGKKVAVVAGTAHEAFLKALFTEVDVRPYDTPEQTREALRKGEVDLLFGDGISLAFWLNGTDSQNCCAFRGGPFIEAATSARASASRSSAATTRCGRRSTGRCSGCGKRAASPICGCAISRSARFDRRAIDATGGGSYERTVRRT